MSNKDISKRKIISISTFRSTTIGNELCKTYVVIYNTGVVLICKRLLLDIEDSPMGYISIKKFKNVHIVENAIGFKINSFNTIVEIVNNVKPYFKESEIIL